MNNQNLIEVKIPFSFQWLSEEDIQKIVQIQDYYLRQHKIYLTSINIIEMSLQFGSTNHIRNSLENYYQITRCKTITNKIIKSDK